MDIKAYIESGILEDYVLGLISESEAKAVEQNLQKYQELKTELHQIEDALASYAQAKAMPMPAGLSTQIMQSIENLESSASATTDTIPTKATPQATSPKGGNILGIVLGLALAGALLGSFFLNQQKNEAQNQLALAQTQVSDINDRMVTLQLDCDQKDGTIQRLQEQITILKNPAYKPITLKGTDKAPNAETIVYFDPSADKSYLDVGTLPAAPSDKDYQLWALIDGQPTDMGIVNLTAANGLIEVPVIPNAQAFAITLEDRDGNPAPNLAELYVLGEV